MPVLSDSRKPPMKSKERQPIRIHKPLQAATSYDNMTKAELIVFLKTIAENIRLKAKDGNEAAEIILEMIKELKAHE